MYWDPSGTSVLGEVFSSLASVTFRSERERVPIHAIPLPPRASWKMSIPGRSIPAPYISLDRSPKMRYDHLHVKIGRGLCPAHVPPSIKPQGLR